MDRPTGPRHPPDKRHEAYESIFGRPSTSHHLLPQQGQYYHPPLPVLSIISQGISQQTSARPMQPRFARSRATTASQDSLNNTNTPHITIITRSTLPQHPGHALVPPSTHGRAPSVVSLPPQCSWYHRSKARRPTQPRPRCTHEGRTHPCTGLSAGQGQYSALPPTTVPRNGAPLGKEIGRLGPNFASQGDPHDSLSFNEPRIKLP
ncbi:hypothetical protein F5J12DRAFT_897344 [Pisolithus orientalis]|uniref:uncharacterized protein n=1 Tax=Pisolithus orientalis TaxID=936130 RepID=UPI0022258A89|nr:uncharacterized protein F5J12DRAFT_897344 [Pisolithus orientalis]KAI5992316.1 hypothetical protein F5J12DRAFT_897344 [Pisolithus orientalis]